MNELAPIFIHAAPRASGTFLFENTRLGSPGLFFFEPFHETLSLPLHISRGRPDSLDPFDEQSGKHGFATYIPLETPFGGVRGYRKSFASERLLLAADEPHPALESYVESLVAHAHAHDLRPVFKPIWSQGRIAWLKQRFPGTHFSLIRNPEDQFRSYVSFSRAGNWYFLAKLCQDFAFTAQPKASQWTSRFADVPLFTGDLFAEELQFYQMFAQTVDLEVLYFMFIYLWAIYGDRVLRESDLVIELPLSREDYGRLETLTASQDFHFTVENYISSPLAKEIFDAEPLADIRALALSCVDRDYLRRGPRSTPADMFVTPDTRALLEQITLRKTGDSTEAMRGVGHFARFAEAQLLDRQAAARLAGTYRQPPPSPFLAYGHREEKDEDRTLRVSPKALYLGRAARVVEVRGGSAVEISCSAMQVACFGPHFALPPGRYWITFDLEMNPADDAGEAVVSIVEGGTGAPLTHEQAFSFRGRRSVSIECVLEQSVAALEPRLSVHCAMARVHSMQIVSER